MEKKGLIFCPQGSFRITRSVYILRWWKWEFQSKMRPDLLGKEKLFDKWLDRMTDRCKTLCLCGGRRQLAGPAPHRSANDCEWQLKNENDPRVKNDLIPSHGAFEDACIRVCLCKFKCTELEGVWKKRMSLKFSSVARNFWCLLEAEGSWTVWKMCWTCWHEKSIFEMVCTFPSFILDILYSQFTFI